MVFIAQNSKICAKIRLYMHNSKLIVQFLLYFFYKVFFIALTHIILIHQSGMVKNIRIRDRFKLSKKRLQTDVDYIKNHLSDIPVKIRQCDFA